MQRTMTAFRKGEQMRHIFISHAGKDSEIAKRLYNDLKDVGHDVCIDLQELKIGSDSIEFMNNAISDAHTVVVIFSANTDSAIWQKKEINAAVWHELAQEGGKVIVLKYGEVKLPPLLGAKIYGSLDADKYKKTLQLLCTEIVSSPSATSIINIALKENSTNPFWRIRAEYFEEMPSLMADAFSPPVSGTFANWEQMLPCFLEGSRGTGKTMLLLSLRARILAARSLANENRGSQDKKLEDLFGVYVRLGRGAICNAGFDVVDGKVIGDTSRSELAQLSDLFQQEFYLCIVESLVSELIACDKGGHLTIGPTVQADLANRLAFILKPTETKRMVCLDELLGLFAEMHVQLADFIRRKFIYKESSTVPFTNCDLELLKRVTELVKGSIQEIKNTQITILLDEYENLLDYQKIVVNSLVKLGPPKFSVKVARKAGTEETSATNVGQELQESHDYTRIPLIYSVEDESDFERYLSLLENMVKRTLATHGLPELNLGEFLPSDESPEVSEEHVLSKVLELARIKREDFETLTKQKQREQISYYREAAVYRHLYGTPGRRTKKRFSGHKDLAFVSSGVIRYFQEIVGMAFHLHRSSNSTIKFPILPKYQSEAVYLVSDHNLSMLSRNVETFGESLKYFLLDLGDCLRHKLLRHSSEPEAGRIAIKDPELMSDAAHNLLKRMINIGVKEGVFQTIEGRPGTRPKHVEDPQPVEVNIARIYTPTLQISPRLRWTTLVKCDELEGLLSPITRRKTKVKLISRLQGRSEYTRQEQKKQIDRQQSLFTEIDE
jgi:hypothetical protein